MDHALFKTLLRNLQSVGVLSFPEGEDPPKDFSEKYCYHPVLEACYAAETFASRVRTLPPETIWEMRDAVGIRILLFRLDGNVWIVGPFVLQGFEEKKMRAVLASHGVPASYIPSLQLYYSAFPMVSNQELVHTVRALIQSLAPGEEEFAFRNLSTEESESGAGPVHARYQARFDYQSIQKRYELENRFLRMIEEGDVDKVQGAFDNMGIASLNNRRYMDAVYSNPEVSLAMVRALSRKAAERGGAPLAEINEITQHSVQTARGLKNEEALIRNLHTMIMGLTQAVRRARLSEEKYSLPIRKAIIFLRQNFSQNISLEEIAEAAGYAPSYLSRQFKAEVGMTVSEVLRKLRCDEAARLLRETGLPVAEISAYVGYPDNNYFVKVFQKDKGMTPGAWRKMR